MKLLYITLLILIICTSCENRFPELTVVELDKKELLLRVNEESKLYIDKYSPEKPKDLFVEWYSLDTTHVVVFNGVVKGISPGETYVYAKVNGVESIACKIIVYGVYDEQNDVYILGNYGKTLIYWKNGIPTQIAESKHRIIGKARKLKSQKIPVQLPGTYL